MIWASGRGHGEPGNGVKISLRLEDYCQRVRNTHSDAKTELPYEGGKEMLLVEDVDNRELLQDLLQAMYEELPAGKKR